MMFNDGRWELVGITSYGTGCALAEYAGVYTRVSIYVPWIQCLLLKNSSCINEIFIKKTSFSSSGISLSASALHLFALVLSSLSAIHHYEE